MLSKLFSAAARRVSPFLLALGLLAPPTYGQEVLQSTDKFSGVTHYFTRKREADLEGGSFFSGRYVSFDLHSSSDHGDMGGYTLGVMTLTSGWIFIRASASLDLKLDDTTLMHLTGEGSLSSRNVLSGSSVQEAAFYDLSPDQLDQIAHAAKIEFRLYGAEGTITGTIPPVFSKDAASFRALVPAPSNVTVVGRPTLGVQVIAIPANGRAAMHIPEDHGLMVMTVTPGSQAEQAGLVRTDVLLTINGKPMRAGTDIPMALQEAKDGKPAVFHIWRGGTELDLTAPATAPGAANGH